MSWTQVVTAALGGGGGGGGVTLDLNELINPIGEHVYNLMYESVQIEMPDAAAAYPAAWDKETFERVKDANDAHVGWADSLEWNMGQDTWWPNDEINWRLLVNWQWVYLPPSDEALALGAPENGFFLIHNARATVDLDAAGHSWVGWKLSVDARFDNPQMSAGVATIPVWFHIRSEQHGDVFRDTWRGFEIRGDGTKVEVQTTG